MTIEGKDHSLTMLTLLMMCNMPIFLLFQLETRIVQKNSINLLLSSNIEKCKHFQWAFNGFSRYCADSISLYMSMFGEEWPSRLGLMLTLKSNWDHLCLFSKGFLDTDQIYTTQKVLSSLTHDLQSKRWCLLLRFGTKCYIYVQQKAFRAGQCPKQFDLYKNYLIWLMNE